MRLKSWRRPDLKTLCPLHRIISKAQRPKSPTGKFNIYSPVYQRQPLRACVVMKVNLAACRQTEKKCLLSRETLCN